METFTAINGEGPAVVLLHGMFATADCWEPTAADLSRDHRVIVPDLPGHGRSTTGAQPYSLSFYVQWLHDLLDELGVEQAVLVGNSMGGAISLAYARAHPERVSALVLANPLGMSTAIPWDSGWRLLVRGRHMVAAALTGHIKPHVFRYLEGWLVRQPWGRFADVLERMTALNFKQGLVSVLAGVRLLLVDFLPQGRRIRFAQTPTPAPALVVWGAHDGLLPARHATEARERFPTDRYVIFANSAHMPMLDEPEAFNALVREFLTDIEKDVYARPAAHR